MRGRFPSRSFNPIQTTKKASIKRYLLFGGGEGPLPPFFEFFININTVDDLFLKRGLEIEDLCLYNKIYY